MPSKLAIIDNIEEYSASELVNYIKDGIVTFDELCEETDGYFSADVRKEVERMLVSSEDEAWRKVKRDNNEDAYLAFLKAYPDSPHADEARNEIRRLKKPTEGEAKQSIWDSVDKTSVIDLRAFIRENPEDSHVREARKLINALRAEELRGSGINALVDRINYIQTDKSVNDPDAAIAQEIISYLELNRISPEDLINLIKRDNNLLRASVLNELLKNGYIGYADLEEADIDPRFVDHLSKAEETQVHIGLPPRELQKINKVSTEVYFWGIPSSGKSCALGAIISVANNGTVAKSMSKDPDCQGYGYMNRLSQLFKSDGEVRGLPPGTPTCATYEMAFDLEDERGASHPITCIDLAGELVRCMYKSDAGESMSDDEVKALETLTNVLIDNRSINRKIHFFVLEYGGESRNYEGLNQTVYLDAALRYIERTKIFEKETDAIYLMITKVDKIGKVGHDLVEILTQYIDKNYKGFYNGLQKICKDHEINGGIVERIPFSLGKVCFQDFCLFNEAPAANVIKKLLLRSKGFKNGKFRKAIDGLRK